MSEQKIKVRVTETGTTLDVFVFSKREGLGVCAAETLLLRTRHSGAPFLNKPMDRSFSLRMPYLMQI